jgi:hypothetical protein
VQRSQNWFIMNLDHTARHFIFFSIFSSQTRRR